MIYASVCSGIEAPTVAWHGLGWRAAWFSEIEAFPCAVLAHHYPTVPNLGDMTRIHEREEFQNGSIDLLVGGTPCQSFSVAGLRGGLADPRGNLALVFLALADRARPRWVVWENVPGVLSSNGGRDFGAFLGGLAELGYGFAYRVLDAQHFGVAQRRRRVFVVGYLGDWRRAAAVLFERASLSGDPAPRRKTRERIAPTLSARTKGGGGLGTDFDLDGGLIDVTSGNQRNDAETETLIPSTARCLTSGNQRNDADLAKTLLGKANSSHAVDQDTYVVAHSLRGEGHDASEDGTGRGSPLVAVFDPNQITSKDNRSTCEPGISHTLPASSNAPIAFSSKDFGADATVDLSTTLRASGHVGSHANAGAPPAVTLGHSVRRLTPRECERLQAFPDDYTLIPYRGKPASNGPRYKALGNSMCTNVVRWIGERIQAVEEIQA